MEAIETGRAASRASCDSMRDVLLRQEFNGEIPAGLAARHQGRAQDRLDHRRAARRGVVYPSGRRPYVLVVLTRGIRRRGGSRGSSSPTCQGSSITHVMSASARRMNVALGTDHGGFALKATIAEAIVAAGHDGRRLWRVRVELGTTTIRTSPPRSRAPSPAAWRGAAC